MTIRLNDAHAIKLVAEATRINLGAKIFCIADYDDTDKLLCGALLMGDNDYSMEIHFASFVPNFVRQEMLWAVFNYIFKVRKIKKLFGRVPENNKRARKFNKHLGFKEEAILADVYPDREGLVIMSMYEKDCKYINDKPPEVNFASPDKTNIIEVHEYSQSNVGQ
jgi:RimJ/RimL family protein N-acetyltransferase